jgi:NADH-quinone oxidoreductase subunit E
VQSEQSCITPDGIAFCSDILGITKAQVSAVATFYTMYKRVPTGEYLVSVCTNTLCGMLGGDEIYAAVSDALGVANNETTPDKKFTIERAECLAACDYAPVVTVNYEFYDNQTVESTTDLLTKLSAGERPLPTRGAPLCSFKQAERQIAGFFTDEDYALEATASGAPTEVGVRLAVDRGDSAPSYAVDDASERTGADAERSTATAGQGPSQNDAPLSTAESDSSNSTTPGASRDD